VSLHSHHPVFEDIFLKEGFVTKLKGRRE